MIKIRVKDGRGERVVTEVRRPDPQAVLVFNDKTPFDITDAELQVMIDLGYVALKDVRIVDPTGKEHPVKAVFTNSFAIQTGEENKPADLNKKPEWAKSNAEIEAEKKANAEKIKAEAKAEQEKDDAAEKAKNAPKPAEPAKTEVKG